MEKNEEKEVLGGKEEEEKETSEKAKTPCRKSVPCPSETVEDVAALLISTSRMSLTQQERAALTRFCAAHRIPVLPRDVVNRRIGPAPTNVLRSALGNRVAGGEHELTYPSCLKALHLLLLEAKEAPRGRLPHSALPRDLRLLSRAL